MKKKFKFLFGLVGAGLLAVGVGSALKCSAAEVKADAPTFIEEVVTVTHATIFKSGEGRWQFIIWFGGDATPDYDDIENGKAVDSYENAKKPVNSYKYSEYLTINGTKVTPWSGWDNRCIFRKNSDGVEQFQFDIAWNPVAEDRIVINKGMQIASYDYVINGNDTNPKAFVLDRSYVFTVGSAGNALRPLQETYVETAVDRVSFQSEAHATRKFDGWFELHLTENDYPTVAGTGIYAKGFNLWNAAYTSKIGTSVNAKTFVTIVDNNSNTIAIANDYGQYLTAYKGDNYKGCFSFRVLSLYDSNNEARYPSSITIKAGTKFVSLEYLADSEATVPHSFMTTTEVTFSLVNGSVATNVTLGNKTLVESFNKNELKMDTIPTSEIGTGLCKTEGWYTAAKAKYATFLANDKALFNGNYSDASARLSAWATANGEVFNGNSFSSNLATMINDPISSNALFIIIAVSASVLSFGVLVILKKRKENKVK